MSVPTARGFRPAWLVALLLGGAALWLVLDQRATLAGQRAQLDAARVTAQAERLAAEQRLGSAAADAERAAAEDAAARASLAADLQARLDAEQAQLEAVTAERDRALAELAQAGSSHGQLEAELAETKDQRLKQIGESARLLEQVLDRDRRLEVLNRSLAQLREQGALAERPAAVVTIAHGDTLASHVSEALRRSGAGQAVVLEAQLGDGGALSGVLARLTSEGHPARLISAQRATLCVTSGRASLRLEGLSGDVGGAPSPLDIDLPSFDETAWSSAGVAVPASFRAVGDVSRALGGLLEGFGWQLDALHGVEGATLLGVELSQHDDSGQLLRSLRAPRAALAAGPELTLWDGSVTTGGDERLFFEGIFRLPLPGLDAAAWDAALGLGAR